MNSSKKRRAPSYADLLESSAREDDARLALERYRERLKAGSRPEIWYSDLGGWSIVDPLDSRERSN